MRLGAECEHGTGGFAEDYVQHTVSQVTIVNFCGRFLGRRTRTNIPLLRTPHRRLLAMLRVPTRCTQGLTPCDRTILNPKTARRPAVPSHR